MVVVAIDPGACSGWAVFVDGKLSTCGIARAPAAVAAPDGARFFIEGQEIRRKGRVRPADIIKLAQNAGAWVGMNPGRPVTWVQPATWKGTARKEWCTARILAALRPDERAMVDAMPIAKTYKHNMIDAIGIGLYSAGRFARGKAVRP